MYTKVIAHFPVIYYGYGKKEKSFTKILEIPTKQLQSIYLKS